MKNCTVLGVTNTGVACHCGHQPVAFISDLLSGELGIFQLQWIFARAKTFWIFKVGQMFNVRRFCTSEKPFDL